MNANEIMGMSLNDLTVEHFIIIMGVTLISAVFAVVILLSLLSVLKLLIDLVCFLLFKDKRLGGWWFKRSVCSYIGRLKKQVINSPTEKAYYLYYNRLIGAVEALEAFGIIDSRLWLKFTAVPKYEFLRFKEKYEFQQKNGDE